MRYELGVEFDAIALRLAPTLSARLKFIASYQGNTIRSQWTQTYADASTGDVFLGMKFTRSLLP